MASVCSCRQGYLVAGHAAFAVRVDDFRVDVACSPGPAGCRSTVRILRFLVLVEQVGKVKGNRTAGRDRAAAQCVTSGDEAEGAIRE